MFPDNDGFKSKLIGTPRQVADRILLLRSLGIDLVLTAFLHFQGEPLNQVVKLKTDSGWFELTLNRHRIAEEVEQFGKQVIPLVREGEAQGRGIHAAQEIELTGSIYQE